MSTPSECTEPTNFFFLDFGLPLKFGFGGSLCLNLLSASHGYTSNELMETSANQLLCDSYSPRIAIPLDSWVSSFLLISFHLKFVNAKSQKRAYASPGFNSALTAEGLQSSKKEPRQWISVYLPLNHFTSWLSFLNQRPIPIYTAFQQLSISHISTIGIRGNFHLVQLIPCILTRNHWLVPRLSISLSTRDFAIFEEVVDNMMGLQDPKDRLSFLVGVETFKFVPTDCRSLKRLKCIIFIYSFNLHSVIFRMRPCRENSLADLNRASYNNTVAIQLIESTVIEMLPSQGRLLSIGVKSRRKVTCSMFAAPSCNACISYHHFSISISTSMDDKRWRRGVSRDRFRSWH